MLENTTPHNVIRTLLSRPAGRWWRQRREEKRWIDSRIWILVTVVLDLLLEVEALRAALLATDAGAMGKDSAYGRAYRDTAYLAHNSCGPSTGLEKLVALFYPSATEGDGVGGGNTRAWRESLMLRRLGFSEEEVSAYKREAEEAEMFT